MRVALTVRILDSGRYLKTLNIFVREAVLPGAGDHEFAVPGARA